MPGARAVIDVLKVKRYSPKKNLSLLPIGNFVCFCCDPFTFIDKTMKGYIHFFRRLGYWNFTTENPDACQQCTCNVLGTTSLEGCHQDTGIGKMTGNT